MKYYTLQEFENAVNTIANQIIFVNALGEWEYHPERTDFLLRYFYAKNVLKYDFKSVFDLQTDIFSLGFFEEIEKELDKVVNIDDYQCNTNYDQSCLKSAVYDKVTYLKELSLQRSNYSLTDAYLAALVDKLNGFIEDKGVEKTLTILAQAGDQLIKESDQNGNKNIHKSKQKAK